MALSIEYEFAPTKITNQDNFICTTGLTINTNSNSTPDELAHKWSVLCKKNLPEILRGIKEQQCGFWYIIACLLSVASRVISPLDDNKSVPVTRDGIMPQSRNKICWADGLWTAALLIFFAEAVDIVTFRAARRVCFQGVQPCAPKQTNWARGVW